LPLAASISSADYVEIEQSGSSARTSIGAITAQLGAFAVISVNGRVGTVTIRSSDVTGALGYTPVNAAGGTLNNGIFTGTNQFPTQSPGDNSTFAATTAFVTASFLTVATASATYLTQANAASTYLTQSNASSTYLTQANATSTYLTQSSASSTYAPLTSPTFLGTPAGPTAAAGTSTTQFATTAFVGNQAPRYDGAQALTLAQQNQVQANIGGFTYYVKTGVNFNAGNTDNAFAITIPNGFTRYRVSSAIISQASASLTTATCSLWTGAGGTGIALVASGSAITVNTANENTTNNSQSLTATGVATVTAATLYFRVQTAQGSAATGTVTLIIQPVS